MRRNASNENRDRANAGGTGRKRSARIAFTAIAAIACASNGGGSSDDGYKQLVKANAAALDQLSYGLSKQAATAIMGRAEVRPPWANDRGIGPQVVHNPFDTLRFESPAGETYEVQRYAVRLVGEHRCPFVHGDAELIPLIFVEGELVGWRWSYMESVLQRRLRRDERSWSVEQLCSGDS
jgi:hypothetical protein